MPKKIKIAHLSSAHPDGDARIFHKMCVSLANLNFEVHLILAGVSERNEKGVVIHSVTKHKGNRFKRVWKTVNEVYVKAIEIDADVYHLHDPELLRIGKKLIRKGKKVIYDAHEDLPRQILAKEYLKFRKTVSKQVEKWENRSVKKMTGIITATPFIRDRFIKINPNTIDINNFPILEELTVQSSSKGNAICYVGNISNVRGINEILEVAENLPSKLILAGKFETEELFHKAKNHPNWKNIDYRGFVNRDEVRAIYQESCIGLVTLHPIINYLDALPVKMFEYMAAGLAVIASDFPLWKTIVLDDNCGICVDPLAPSLINHEIIKLLNNPNKINEFGQNGVRIVNDKYNWREEESKLIHFYNQTLSK